MPPPNKNRKKPKTNTLNAAQIDAVNKQIIAADKRQRNTLSSSSEYSSPDFTHSDKMSAQAVDTFNPLLDTIKKMMHDMYTNLKTDINEASESVKQELGTRMDNMSTELRGDINRVDKKVEALSVSVDSRINSISNEIKLCRDQLDGAEDDFLRGIRTSELKLIGLKYTVNENLNAMLNKIAAIIGVQFKSQTPTILRTSKWVNNEQIPQNVILIKFLAPHLKEEFYKSYLTHLRKKSQLTLDLLGIGSKNERLAIGENLTPHHQKLFATCMTLKKEGKIAQVFTYNGITNIKLKQGEKATPIKIQRDLDMFLVKSGIKKSKPMENRVNITDTMLLSTINALI